MLDAVRGDCVAAVGGSTLMGGSGAWRTTPDAPCDCSLLCSEMYSLIKVAMNICSCILRDFCLYHTRFSDSSVLSGLSNTIDPPGNQCRRAVRSVPKTYPFSFEEVCYFLTGLPLPCSALMSQSMNHLRLTNQKCEATGKQDATLWRLTSTGTHAILRGVGRSPGDGVALEAGPRCLRGVWGMANDSRRSL
jgi:hypothetical protein